jgi:pentatricopeptide repeat protein
MTTAVYNVLIDTYLRANQFPRAVKLFDEMHSSGVKKDAHTFNLIMEGYLRRYDYEAARRVFFKMTDHGMSQRPCAAALVFFHVIGSFRLMHLHGFFRQYGGRLYCGMAKA